MAWHNFSLTSLWVWVGDCWQWNTKTCGENMTNLGLSVCCAETWPSYILIYFSADVKFQYQSCTPARFLAWKGKEEICNNVPVEMVHWYWIRRNLQLCSSGDGNLMTDQEKSAMFLWRWNFGVRSGEIRSVSVEMVLWCQIRRNLYINLTMTKASPL